MLVVYEDYMHISVYATHPSTPNEECREVSNAMLRRLGCAGKKTMREMKMG